MNCCLKSGIQKYPSSGRVHVLILHWVRGLSFVDFSYDRECCIRVRHCGWTLPLHENSTFQIRKDPQYLIPLFCDKFHHRFVHQAAKVCILQPHLRTRRYVGFRISSHPVSGFTVAMSVPGVQMQSEFSRLKNLPEHARRGSTSVLASPQFSLLFLHPFRHRFGAAYQAGILSAASRGEMADVEQMKKMVPFVRCESFFGQCVCELMFGVDLSNLNLRVQVNPVKQAIKSNSVGS